MFRISSGVFILFFNEGKNPSKIHKGGNSSVSISIINIVVPHSGII